MSRALTRQERGFTLVEAIIVIVIIGVLSAVVAVFIRAPVQSYVDSAGRAEVSDEADLALRRIARDLRRALPNSIRVTPDGHAIEFLLTVAGGRYLAADDDVVGPGQSVLDFVNPAKTTFTVLGATDSLNQRAVNGDYVVVYNLGQGFSPADAWQYQPASSTAQANIASANFIKDAGGNVTSIQMERNPFPPPAVGVDRPPMPSPTHRFQVVRGPVTYYCGAKNGVLSLWRVSDYDISPTYADPVAGTGNATWAMIATKINDCSGLFKYSVTTQPVVPSPSANMQRSAVVVMALALRARNDTDPTIRLVDQIHVDNTP